MVTIAPPDPANARVSFLQGVQQTLPQQLGSFLERRRETKESDELQRQLSALDPNASLTDRLKTVLGSKASDATKQKFFEMIKMQGAQDFAKKLSEKGEAPSLSDILEGDISGYLSPGVAQEMVRSLGNLPKKEQTNRIASLFGIPEETLSGIDPKDAFKFGLDNEERNLKLDTDIVSQGERAAQEAVNIGRLGELIQQGAFDPGSWGNVSNALEEGGYTLGARFARAFESPESAEANSLIKEFFTGLKDIVPAKGMTLYIEKLFRTMLPIMGRSPEANMAALGVISKINAAKQIPLEVREEILRENNGRLPWNFTQEYRNRLARRSVERLHDIESDAQKVIDQYGASNADNRNSFSALPDAAQFKGKTMTNQETGEKVYSDGKTWKRVRK